MPSPATLEVPTMFKIIQNWPTLHFQEFFPSPQRRISGPTRGTGFGPKNGRLWFPKGMTLAPILNDIDFQSERLWVPK